MKRIQDRHVWKQYSLLTHQKESCLEKKKEACTPTSSFMFGDLREEKTLPTLS